MSLSNVVKLLLFASAGWATACLGSTAYPDLGCGRYLVQGTVMRNGNGHFLVVMDHGSYSPREFILLGGSASEKMAHVKRLAQVEVYVPNPIDDQAVPLVVFEKFHPLEVIGKTDFVRKVADAKCRDVRLFQK